jgi:hypothetical protein
MHVPPAANAALVQPGRRSRPKTRPAQETMSAAPTTSRTRTRRPLTNAVNVVDMIAVDGRCNYVSPEGERCNKKPQRQIARHWITCHAMAELKRVQKGELDLAQAIIINTEERERIASEYKTRCPFPFCQNASRADKYHVRLEPLLNHMQGCAKKAAHGKRLNPQGLLAHAKSSLRLLRYDKEVFRDEFEAAVWMILDT